MMTQRVFEIRNTQVFNIRGRGQTFAQSGRRRDIAVLFGDDGLKMYESVMPVNISPL